MSGLRLALYEPDRPHNLGMVLRLAACTEVAVEVIEPCGFPLDDRRIRFGALDYIGLADWRRHAGLEPFLAERARDRRRVVLLSTRGSAPYHRVGYRGDDVLLLGSESAGVPDAVHARADLSVRIPLRPGVRSLNLVTAAAIVLGEALRQTGGLDRPAMAEEG